MTVVMTHKEVYGTISGLNYEQMCQEIYATPDIPQQARLPPSKFFFKAN